MTEYSTPACVDTQYRKNYSLLRCHQQSRPAFIPSRLTGIFVEFASIVPAEEREMTRRSFALVALCVLPCLAGCADSSISCGSIAGGDGTPSITFTSVPALGSAAPLTGQVAHVIPASYFVAVYIFVPSGGGWWVKPTFASPATFLHCDGTFSADIDTGGQDGTATVITTFLLPNTYSPPLLSGSAALPSALYAAAVATVSVSR